MFPWVQRKVGLGDPPMSLHSLRRRRERDLTSAWPGEEEPRHPTPTDMELGGRRGWPTFLMRVSQRLRVPSRRRRVGPASRDKDGSVDGVPPEGWVSTSTRYDNEAGPRRYPTSIPACATT